VIAGPVVLALLVLVIGGLVEMAELVEYALGVPPALVVLERDNLEQPNIQDRPI
jgi:hypothetical protein